MQKTNFCFDESSSERGFLRALRKKNTAAEDPDALVGGFAVAKKDRQFNKKTAPSKRKLKRGTGLKKGQRKKTQRTKGQQRSKQNKQRKKKTAKAARKRKTKARGK